MLQLSSYLLLCVVIFLPYLRTTSSPDVLSNDDMSRVLSLSVGAILLFVPVTHKQGGEEGTSSLKTLLPILLTISAIFCFLSFGLLFSSILKQPIVIFGVLASYLLGLALGLSLSPILKIMVELVIKSDRVKLIQTEAALVRKLVYDTNNGLLPSPRELPNNKEKTPSPKIRSSYSSAKQRRSKRSTVKFADLIGPDCMEPQPSEENLEEHTEGHKNQHESYIQQQHASSSQIINNTLNVTLTPFK